MRISLNWLSDYVELPGSPEALASSLTMVGLEVEAIEHLGAGLDSVVVAQVLEKVPHPDAEKLSCVKVDAGAHGHFPIVCGAKNFKVGDKVPLAMIGASLPNGVTIQQAKLRGVDSFGMLCSARELGLEESVDGLLILDSSLPLGQPIADALGLKDTVFEINVTPNRADCLSHLGIAREVAALEGKPLRMPEIAPLSEGVERSGTPIVIDASADCPRYTARRLEDLKLGPSPRWMQSRLRAVGVRALSNAVDVTNYVLLECGQPLHAFDLDRLEGERIQVRKAREGEALTTLDGKSRSLSGDDLLICDAKSPVALAGVMGGATSEVTEATHRILLESATFAPTTIRRTAHRHALRSEASHRFERGIDPRMVAFARDRACYLMAKHCGATLVRGCAEAGSTVPEPRVVTLEFARVGRLLGLEVGEAEVRGRLQSIGFTIEGNRVTIPSWRLDVEGEADCVEEIARLRGIESIPAVMPRAHIDLPPVSHSERVHAQARLTMAAWGYDEVLNYSFVSPRELEILTPAIAPLLLKNPISAEMRAMGTTRLAGILGNVKRNLNRQLEDLRLYEIGNIYRPSAEDPQRVAHEEQVLAGVLTGHAAPARWTDAPKPVDFYDLKGMVESLLDVLNVREFRFEATESTMLHPRSACRLVVGERPVGLLGELHPTVAQALDLPRGLFVFEFALEPLVEAAVMVPRYRPIPRFPAVTRDLALVLDATIPWSRVEAVVRETSGGLLEDLVLFDVYRGGNIPAHKRSLAFALRLRHAERTLGEDEVTALQAALVARLESEFGAELRL